jgi:hypothetical protein
MTIVRSLTFPFVAATLLLLAGCSKQPSSTTPPAGGSVPPTNTATPPADAGHGEEKPLGSLTVGAHTFQVVQAGAVVPGKEAFFDLDFGAGKPIPATVRGWIGVEAGTGSRKASFGKEGDHGAHGHVDVPATLPAGSMLWIEIEEGGKTERKSIATK